MLPTPASPPALAEDVLVQRLLARDEQALRLLYENYSKSLLLVITRLVRNEELARDILQESLLKVWTNIGSYDADRGRLFTWMARICGNMAIDVLRTPRQRFHAATQVLDLTPTGHMSATSSFNPEHIGLRELTHHLTPVQREVVELLYFGGCTQAEASEQLGIPLATVKSRVRGALKVLARLMR